MKLYDTKNSLRCVILQNHQFDIKIKFVILKEITLKIKLVMLSTIFFFCVYLVFSTLLLPET